MQWLYEQLDTDLGLALAFLACGLSFVALELGATIWFRIRAWWKGETDEDPR